MGNRLDIRNVNKAIAISHWCQENLRQEEWKMVAIRMYPAHYKFEFKDAHTTTLAILSS